MSHQFHRSKIIDLPHGMFNRHDGLSPSPYASLNMSYGVGDNPLLVTANRIRIKNVLGASVLLSAEQEHADRIYNSSALGVDTEVKGYDALITDQPGVALLIQQADCQAILIHDPDKGIIAAVHCGWRGSVINIIGLTIAEMHRIYRTDPASLKVAISPSLGPCCAEFINYRRELPRQLHQYQESPYYFNFWEISRYQLATAGVNEKHIDTAGICTSCNQDYFSYRRTKKKGELTTGRNGSAICLPIQ